MSANEETELTAAGRMQAETNFHLCNVLNELQAAMPGVAPADRHNLLAALQIVKGVQERQ